MLDLSLTKTFFNSKLTFVLGVKNLFDVTDLDRLGGTSGEAHTGGNNALPIGFGRTLFAKFNFTID
jgi:outer membrane receptor protein involved in Fe transport